MRPFRRYQHSDLDPGLRPARPLPRRLRKPRVLVLGCGDVGLRFVQAWSKRLQIIAVARSAQSRDQARAAGARAIHADLDDPASLRRLRGLAPRVLHSAPPPDRGRTDPRTRHALSALHATRRWVYLSTSGVYGDCAGDLVEEHRPVAPRNDRAFRRVSAETLLRTTRRALILRVPGIYAEDRLPLQRLHQGTPALLPAEDGYTNHIHADDLARIAFYALWRGGSGRVMHAVDASDMRMGDWFDAVADTFGLSRPPRLAREAVRAQVSPMLWSFMSESRRLSHRRLHRELRCGLVWPTVTAFLASLKARRADTEGQTDPR